MIWFGDVRFRRERVIFHASLVNYQSKGADRHPKHAAALLPYVLVNPAISQVLMTSKT
jgi:hypothetical protein